MNTNFKHEYEDAVIKDYLKKLLSGGKEGFDEAYYIYGYISDRIIELERKKLNDEYEELRRDLNRTISLLVKHGVSLTKIVDFSGIPRSTFYRLRKGVGLIEKFTLYDIKNSLSILEKTLISDLKKEINNKLDQEMTSCGRISDCGNNLCGGCGDKSS